ncbi:flagellar basal body L-ring protein FlgH, partial [Halomonas sp. BBD48]|nr:flagellar basal body L-ring protein FlgH [Halomonas sp. BBD48]
MGNVYMRRREGFGQGRFLHWVLTLAALLVLGGCAQLPQPSVVGEQERIVVVEPPPPVANGSIFQPARGYQPLFEDRRPRMIGDILT